MKKKLNILVVYQYFLDKGEPGLSRFNKMVEVWEKEGHHVTVLTGDVHYSTGEKKDKYKGRFITKEQYSHNIDVYKTYVSESYNSSFLGRLWGYFSFTCSSTIALLFKIKKHDVIIVSSPPLFIGITGLVGKYLKRMKLIFEVRDIWPQSAIDLGILNNKIIIKLSYWMENLFYKSADKINVLTPAFKKYLLKKNIDEKKISVIPNGADLDVFYPLHDSSSKEDFFKDKFVITYFGSHSTANKIDLLLKVAKDMQEYKDIVFLLIGSGREKENLVKYATDHQLNNVIFKDPMSREDLNKYVNKVDLCTTVLPNIEVFKTVYPSKLFDYMSLGKPILIGFDGVARELVEKNEIGIYSNVEDIQAFKQSILYFYNNPTMCKEMSIKARKLAETEFNRENLAKEYIEEIRSLISK